MKACILTSSTKMVENIIELDSLDPNSFIPYKSGIELASRHDGEIGWLLLPDNTWQIPAESGIRYTKAQGIRNRRSYKLKESDKYSYPDFPLTNEKRQEWMIYRQALRDITEQPGFPDNVTWPTKPE